MGIRQEERKEREEQADVDGAEGDGVGGVVVAGPGERDKDGSVCGGGAGEAVRGALRPPEQLAREDREAAERGVDVARGKNLAERIRRRGIGGEEWGEWVLVAMRRRNKRRQRGGEAAAGESCYDGGGGGCRGLGFAGRGGE